MGKFKELRVWNDAMELAEKVYLITRTNAFSRDFALCNQITKACISVPSNIAEGDKRGTTKESIYFFNVSTGTILFHMLNLIFLPHSSYFFRRRCAASNLKKYLTETKISMFNSVN